MTTCPTCHEPVLQLDNGTTLNPKPGRLGRHLKDGTLLSGDQIRDPAIRGYYEHQCLPANTRPKQPQPEQTLF